MAKKIDINSILMTTVLLFVICAVVTAALAGTNMLTADRIKAANEKAENDARATLIEADKFEEHTVSAKSILTFDTDTGDETEVTYHEAVKNGKTVGYIVTCAANGYGGDITVMTGVGTDGKIVGLKVLSADDETPGLGQNVLKSDFQQKFIGAEKDNNGVSTITGASYSSRAVIKCSNYALYIADIVNNGTSDNGVKLAESEVDTNG